MKTTQTPLCPEAYLDLHYHQSEHGTQQEAGGVPPDLEL